MKTPTLVNWGSFLTPLPIENEQISKPKFKFPDQRVCAARLEKTITYISAGSNIRVYKL